jgi:hypothetical protein
VAYELGVLKVASSNGSPLLTLAGIKETRAVALDPVRSTLWIWAGKSLQAFGFAGEQRLALPVASQANEGAVLSVNPADGSVWYGRERDLWSVSPAGQALVHLGLQEKLVALAIEEHSGLLWVATEHAVEARDAVSGVRLRALDLHGCDGVNDLAVDAAGRAWVAAKNTLCGFSSSGMPQAHVSFSGLRHVAAGPAGLWAASEKDLRLLAPVGSLSPASQPLPKDGGIKVLRADPATGEAWAASEREVAKVAADGRVLLRLPLSAPGHILDLAVYADRIAPELEIVAPAAGAFLATAMPGLRLRITDVGSGADLASVAARVDGAAAAVTCSTDPVGATCSFEHPLGEGSHNLGVSIADLAGNRSASASTSFTIDTVAPVVTFTAPAEGLRTQTPSVAVTGLLRRQLPRLPGGEPGSGRLLRSAERKLAGGGQRPRGAGAGRQPGGPGRDRHRRLRAAGQRIGSSRPRSDRCGAAPVGEPLRSRHRPLAGSDVPLHPLGPELAVRPTFRCRTATP